MGIKKLWNKMSKTQKSVVGTALFLMFVSSVTAGYLIFYDAGITGYTINSNNPMSFSDDFSMTDLFFINETENKTEFITIDNYNEGYIYLNISIISTFEDESDDCVYNDDCFSNVTYLGNELKDGDIIEVDGGQSQIKVLTECQKWACSGNFSTSIQLTEQ